MLADVTFVVVDLETTGGPPSGAAITEVGAVKVRGGRVLGEFQTLVNPAEPIPAFVSVLTGITDHMVAGAPRIDTVLPAFLDFAGDAVLVAHNAPYDMSFLKAAAEHTGRAWPKPTVVDTAHLARQLVTRDEAPDCRLASLARVFRSATAPDHRALHDARATVDVLHGLLERVGNLGVHTLEELRTFTSRVTAAQRRKRHLAEGLPATPGVYLFKDAQGRVLYIGTARDIRRRVRTYFTASEQRTRMAEMVGLAASVTPVVCLTTLEAGVRELRLIAEHKPRYNRRSRHPERVPWVKLTVEPFPRLSVVRDVKDDGARYVGPFATQHAAEAAIAAVHEVLPLRQCTTRLSPRTRHPECVLAQLGRCGAPCSGAQSEQEYAAIVASAAQLLSGDGRSVVAALRRRMKLLAVQERFEDAGAVRDRTLHLVRGAARAQRLMPLAASPEVVAARRRDEGGWEMVSVRYGRLAGTTVSPAGADPMPFIDALRRSAEVVHPPPAPRPAASPEETELVLRWLETPGTRIVALDGQWSCPVHGAGAARTGLEELLDGSAFAAMAPALRGSLDDPSRGRLRHQPAAAVPSAAISSPAGPAATGEPRAAAV